MTKERVLVTGGAGYLGNRIIRDLLQEDYKVTCLDKLIYNQQETLLPLASNENFEFVFGDVRDKSLIKEALKDHDVILPLAAIVGAPACDLKPYDAKTTNYDAIIMLNKLRGDSQKLICPVTNSGYGTKFEESLCTEESKLEPISLYGKTKVNAEKYLLESDKGAVSLRLATVFGISQRMRRDLMVNDFVYKALTDRNIVLYEENFKRNFINIADVSRAFIHTIKNYENMVGEAYNVGLDEANISKKELAQKIQKHLPFLEIYTSEKGSDPDKRNYIVSNEKIRKKGFEAKVSLDEGIKELIKGYNILFKNTRNTNI
jgi:nucleoside-diphosphate-sugar epimerase